MTPFRPVSSNVRYAPLAAPVLTAAGRLGTYDIQLISPAGRAGPLAGVGLLLLCWLTRSGRWS